MYCMFITQFHMHMRLIWPKKMLHEEGITIPIVTTLHGTDITLVGSHPFYENGPSPLA